ncbi:hypothetical protein WHR41_02512 [Cladosporium halotolerans]|uniref:AMP-activated protein kinase glycogen-binding domain-containing protein n=1 Tax=Cladosporium halotolerans TaxID=1052096 RepID=A0AB34KXK0_9PEZI
MPNPASPLITRKKLEPHQRATIDSLLEASYNQNWPSTQQPHLRPKSSWIGPPPPARLPSHTTMKQKVTITYASPGLQPPVYIATSLSDPQWEPVEMGCAELPGGEREFVKTFHVLEGEYQYKFRLGPGDWWVCDEEKPTVDDGFGNRNNVLFVRTEMLAKKAAANPDLMAGDSSEVDRLAPEHTFTHEKAPVKEAYKRDSLGDDVLVGSFENKPNLVDQTGDHQPPLFAHEQNGPPHHKLDVPPEDVPVHFSRQDTQTAVPDEDHESAHLPSDLLFAHEKTTLPARVPTPGVDEDEDDMEQPPLMKHESLSPTSSKRANDPEAADQHNQHSDNNHSASPVLPTSPAHIPAEADPNDPSLEKFPTHHEGIISSLRRASQRMAEDETTDEVLSSGSPLSKTRSQSSNQSTSLPSVLEDEDEEEEEEEEEEAQTPAPSKTQALAAGLHMLSDTGDRPAALITPPHTPDESKAPTAAQLPASAPHAHDHHHKPQAEKDIREEAKHDVSHHGQDEGAAAKEGQQGLDPAPKSFWGGMWETALGLGLTVLVGAGAAWLAFRLQDSVKDGGAILKG